ncbi:hypothetical protein B0T26DRAFT_748989 [Lasiosphaeria miniovina]|uniref:ABM domain-containing protein n=1 Tax=Lasiosphaeria miniovina TaxID=1954250 RepID=A0AA40B747_9PEZI|nr:uncharacterized protein B0T26DRAFT_748989 [Lasiosphaeria miniovina]KAK0728829.1 hypothetical protein B0T26DRAFT_748989 [Lasiosphaeria miniovina]
MTLPFLVFLYPKPEKLARAEELAQIISDYVKANEPGVLQYQWFRVADDPDGPAIAVKETYADQASLDAHKETPKFAWLVKISQEEDIFRAPLKVLPIDFITGFDRR